MLGSRETEGKGRASPLSLEPVSSCLKQRRPGSLCETPHVLAVSRPRALPRANPEPIPAGGRQGPRLTAAVRGGTRPSPARALPETTSRQPRRVSGNIRARVSCPHRRERRVGVGTRLAKRIPANCFSLKSAGSSRHKKHGAQEAGFGRSAEGSRGRAAANSPVTPRVPAGGGRCWEP